MERRITIPLPTGAAPPIGVSAPPGPGGGGGGADAVARITGTAMNNPVKMRFNIAFFIMIIFSDLN
jgi:hypothetical protein